MAGGYALISIAVMINCYVFAGSKPYGMALETNPDTRYQDGVVHAVNSTVESGAVVIPLGVTMYLDKDYAALLARLEKSQQTWVVDNRLVNAVDADDAFRCLSTYRQGEYLTTDMDSAPNPPTHKVYHALIRRIVDSYLQAVAANRKVPGTTFSVAGRKYLLTRIQDAVALAHAPSITP
jgi:hypothetical protein